MLQESIKKKGKKIPNILPTLKSAFLHHWTFGAWCVCTPKWRGRLRATSSDWLGRGSLNTRESNTSLFARHEVSAERKGENRTMGNKQEWVREGGEVTEGSSVTVGVTWIERGGCKIMTALISKIIPFPEAGLDWSGWRKTIRQVNVNWCSDC